MDMNRQDKVYEEELECLYEECSQCPHWSDTEGCIYNGEDKED